MKALVKCLHSDRGGEYLSKAFIRHLHDHGTTQKLTAHDTPEHNGVAERLNGILLEKVRAMLHASGLPKFLWSEAVRHAVWLKNRTSTKALDGRTPFEALTGQKPDLSNLHLWGCQVWVHDASNSKLESRAKAGNWVGYEGNRSPSILAGKAQCHC
jgi:transposase InsO family protein